MTHMTREAIVTMFKEARYDEAINALLATDDTIFEKKEAYFLVGLAYYETDRYAYAKMFLEVAHQLDRDDALIATMLAIVLDALGEEEEALRLLRRIVSDEKTFVYAYVAMADIDLKLGRFDEAIHHYYHALRLLQSDTPLATDRLPIPIRKLPWLTDKRLLFSMTANGLGTAYFETGDRVHAKLWYAEAALAKPLGVGFFDPYRNLMKVYRADESTVKTVLSA